MILEVDGQGNETARNVYGSNLLMREAGSEKYYYMYNGHGDVTALLGRNGEISATYYYDAFGNITEQTGDADNPIRYAGYQYDEETGIYYLNARYYDPKIARFLTEDTYRGDPNDPLSLNLYTYCHNEPMMYTDPSGHSLLSLIGIGAAIAAGVKAVVNIVSNANKESNKKDKDKDKNKSKDKGSSNNSNNNSGVIQTNKPKEENLNDKGGSGLADMVNQILAGIEQLKAVMKSKDTRDILGANTGSSDFLSRYPGAVASNIIIPGMYSEDMIGYWGTDYPGGTIGLNPPVPKGTGNDVIPTISSAEVPVVAATTIAIPLRKDFGTAVINAVKGIKVSPQGVIISAAVAYLFEPIVLSEGDLETPIQNKNKSGEPAIDNFPDTFPDNPADFNPPGLERKEYKDGDIIKWKDPATGDSVYEWNKDNKYGDHYHYTPDGKNRVPHPDTGDTHINPGQNVPIK